MAAHTIEIYSDVVCPWCYVGKRRLEAALELAGLQATVQVRWRPFELNPTMPSRGMDRKTYLEAKFGSPQAVESMLEHVREAGRQSGIAFAFDRIPRTPNTFDAHRLIWLAGEQQQQDAVVESLFKGYFEEGADLGERDVLVELVARAGLDRVRSLHCLETETSGASVREEERRGLRLGIRAVPHFLIADRPGLSGAHPPPTLAAWLREGLAKEAVR
ncbi:MAG TPA: DsbA family oxidoreductase [Nitrospiraceae bacterium]|nr:DsbA family oxidoreductase [Nitrospiraceae bacterium]